MCNNCHYSHFLGTLVAFGSRLTWKTSLDFYAPSFNQTRRRFWMFSSLSGPEGRSDETEMD